MKKYKLDNCPFCGSRNIKLHRNFDYVYCEDCGARGSHFDGHLEDAVNVWNHIANRRIPQGNIIVSKVNQRTVADGTQGMRRG